jgi:hypothetical protein
LLISLKIQVWAAPLVQPFISLAIGKAYLSAHDPKLVQRHWSFVMEVFIQRGKKHTHRGQCADAPDRGSTPSAHSADATSNVMLP